MKVFSQVGLLCCPTPGCVAQYSKSRYLEKHIVANIHRSPVLSTLNERACNAAVACVMGTHHPIPGAKPGTLLTCVPQACQVRLSPTQEEECRVLHASFVAGWVFPRWSKPVHRKSIKVKQWLDHQFEIGERDKTKKAKPEEVAKRMKTLKNDANAYVFLPSERLGVSQIRAHFAACARSRRTAIQGQLVANSLQSIYQATPSIASMVPPSFNSRNCWIPLLPQPHQDSRDMRTNANECQLPSSESACDPPSNPNLFIFC